MVNSVTAPTKSVPAAPANTFPVNAPIAATPAPIAVRISIRENSEAVYEG